MASTTIYITVRLDIDNPNKDVITADDVQEIVSEIDYQFKNYEDYEVESEICGIND